MTDAVPDRGELPLPDYDHLPLGSLASRIRTLTDEQLLAVLRYEKAHGDRLPVTELIEQRLAQLAAGAEPTGGSPLGEAPETAPGPAAPRTVNQSTPAPTINPPSQGVPTNPAQPR